MRIRKNAKLSPLLFSSSATADDGVAASHVCQLNQSPWDVIPFSSHSILQFDGDEDSFTGNGSLGDSIGAVESVASMMDAEDQKALMEMEDMVVHNNEVLDERRIAEETTSFCQKSDGKNWHCKNEAKQGQSFCDHHFSLLSSYNNNNTATHNNNSNNNNNNNINIPSSKKAAAAAAATAVSAAGARRGKARAATKKAYSSSNSSNPYEFYYYSGFGPSWGKRRGDRNGDSQRKCNEQLKGVENSTITEAEEETTHNTCSSASPSSSSSSQMDNQEFDSEEEEEDANGDSGKKRMRKPVKARSLKSLM